MSEKKANLISILFSFIVVIACLSLHIFMVIFGNVLPLIPLLAIDIKWILVVWGFFIVISWCARLNKVYRILSIIYTLFSLFIWIYSMILGNLWGFWGWMITFVIYIAIPVYIFVNISHKNNNNQFPLSNKVIDCIIFALSIFLSIFSFYFLIVFGQRLKAFEYSDINYGVFLFLIVGGCFSFVISRKSFYSDSNKLVWAIIVPIILIIFVAIIYHNNDLFAQNKLLIYILLGLLVVLLLFIILRNRKIKEIQTEKAERETQARLQKKQEEQERLQKEQEREQQRKDRNKAEFQAAQDKEIREKFLRQNNLIGYDTTLMMQIIKHIENDEPFDVKKIINQPFSTATLIELQKMYNEKGQYIYEKTVEDIIDEKSRLEHYYA